LGQAQWTLKDPTFNPRREAKNHPKNKWHSCYSKAGHEHVVDGMQK